MFAYNFFSGSWDDYLTCTCLSYFIQSFSTSTGQVQVYNANGTKTTTGDLKPSTVLQLKIVATSTYSQTLTNTVTDYFSLTMSTSTCLNNKIALDGTIYSNTSPGGVNIPNISYIIGSTFVTYNPLFSTLYSISTCSITA